VSAPELNRPSSRPPPPSTPPPRATHRTPPYLSRAELEEPPTNLVPQVRRHNSDMPIPLVQRSKSVPNQKVREPVDGTITEALTRTASTPSMQAVTLTSQPPTRPGVMSMRRPGMPLPSAAPVMEAIRMAETRDEALDLLINGLAMVAGRVAIFALRKGSFRGHRCNEAFGDNADFKAVEIPQDVPSILATAAAAGYYLGPIPQTPVHADLLSVMGGHAAEVSATPVRVAGHLALVILLDDLADAMLATKRAEDLARVTSIALGAILHTGR
jgi:hypothetical protein